VNVFGRYLRRFAPPWLAQIDDGEGERQLTALGALSELVRDSLFAMRRMWFPRTAPEAVLWVVGRDRDLQQYPNETAEAYRKRLERAREIHEKAGTKPGLEQALDDAGYPGAVAFELYRLGQFAIADGTYQADGEISAGHNVHAARFDVQIPIDVTDADAGLTTLDIDLITVVVNDQRPAHALPAALVAVFDLVDEDTAPAPTDEDMTVTITTYNLADGTHDADGAIDAGALSVDTEVI
jgi:hypothetical protein